MHRTAYLAVGTCGFLCVIAFLDTAGWLRRPRDLLYERPESPPRATRPPVLYNGEAATASDKKKIRSSFFLPGLLSLGARLTEPLPIARGNHKKKKKKEEKLPSSLTTRKKKGGPGAKKKSGGSGVVGLFLGRLWSISSLGCAQRQPAREKENGIFCTISFFLPILARRTRRHTTPQDSSAASKAQRRTRGTTGCLCALQPTGDAQ